MKPKRVFIIADHGLAIVYFLQTNVQKVFQDQGVEIVFITDDALTVVARLATERKTGARGLRAVLEAAMLDVMYELPSRLDVIGCTITAEVVTQGAEPLLTFRGDARKKKEA